MNNSNQQSKEFLCIVIFFLSHAEAIRRFAVCMRLVMSISFQEVKLKLVILHRLLNK